MYNVCSVHRGMFSTSGGVQYIGGIPWVHRGDTMSTSGGYHEYIGGISWVHRGVFSTSEGYHEYIGGGGCSVHRRDTMSTSGGYHEYIGGCSVHQGDIMIRVGDTMSTWGMFSTSGGYHVYIGGISWVHRGDIMSTSGDVQYIGVFNRNWKDFIKLLPHVYHDIPPMYWTSPDVLMISPRCTHGIPPMYWTSPDVLMVSPHIHHDIPPMYWTSPDVLMISSDVLNIPRCTEHTLYRVDSIPFLGHPVHGNYLEQFRILLPRLMSFWNFSKVEKGLLRRYISRASRWILKTWQRLEAEKILHDLYRIVKFLSWWVLFSVWILLESWFSDTKTPSEKICFRNFVYWRL